MRRSIKKAEKQEKATPDVRAEAPPATPAADASGASLKDTVDELLRRLEENARATPFGELVPFDKVSTAASEHVETLRATHDAQHQAQEMLAMAAKVRGAASEQAEKIVREAQDAAERLNGEAQRHADQVRQETAEWAIEQRSTIDAALRELVDAAARDAEAIRADALGNAMRDAEKTARRYVARAAALGARDAEAIRGEARDVLRRSTAIVTDANVWMQNMAATMKEFVEALDEQNKAMEQLLDEAQNRGDENRGSGSDDDEHLDALIDEALDTERPGGRSGVIAAAAETAAEPDAEQGRPLGSLFRGPDAR